MRSLFAVAAGFAVFGTVTIAHAQCSAGNRCYSRPQYRTPFTSQYRQIPTGSYPVKRPPKTPDRVYPVVKNQEYDRVYDWED